MKSKILSALQWSVVILAIFNLAIYWGTPAVFGWIAAIPAWLALALEPKDQHHGY